MQRRRGTSAGNLNQVTWIISSIFALMVCWSICILILATEWHSGSLVGNTQAKLGVGTVAGNTIEKSPPRILFQKPRNLSRSGSVVATSDVRGNLGPVSVVVQPHPGKDWIHDRWQAASDMHGAAIKGAHWIQLDFGPSHVVATKIVLDWEAAYSDQYRLEASLDPITDHTPTENLMVVFDSTDLVQRQTLIVQKEGQSPGVKSKTPLHVVHTLPALKVTKPFRYLRLYILSSAMGWGVSLWQFDVFGYSEKDQVLV